MIGFIDVFFYNLLNHNELQQLTVNDCLRLAPFSFSFELVLYHLYSFEADP
jgi:hypothetical protein